MSESTMLGLQLWAEHGRPQGSFLTAVLCNDLKNAVGCADEQNRRDLADIVQFAYNNLPAPCWGSPEKVMAWAAKCEAKREAMEVAR